MNKFIIMTAAACMPSSCRFGRYGKIAIVETDGVNKPKQIHPKHKSVKRIVKVWDRMNIGITDRCAFKKAYKEAQIICDKLNEVSEYLNA